MPRAAHSPAPASSITPVKPSRCLAAGRVSDRPERAEQPEQPLHHPVQRRPPATGGPAATGAASTAAGAGTRRREPASGAKAGPPRLRPRRAGSGSRPAGPARPPRGGCRRGRDRQRVLVRRAGRRRHAGLRGRRAERSVPGRGRCVSGERVRPPLRLDSGPRLRDRDRGGYRGRVGDEVRQLDCRRAAVRSATRAASAAPPAGPATAVSSAGPVSGRLSIRWSSESSSSSCCRVRSFGLGGVDMAGPSAGRDTPTDGTTTPPGWEEQLSCRSGRVFEARHGVASGLEDSTRPTIPAIISRSSLMAAQNIVTQVREKYGAVAAQRAVERPRRGPGGGRGVRLLGGGAGLDPGRGEHGPVVRQPDGDRQPAARRGRGRPRLRRRARRLPRRPRRSARPARRSAST